MRAGPKQGKDEETEWMELETVSGGSGRGATRQGIACHLGVLLANAMGGRDRRSLCM